VGGRLPGHRLVLDPRREDHEHPGRAVGREHDPPVVVDLRDPARLVRDRRARGQPGRDRVVELLPPQDLEHLGRRLRTRRPSLGDRGEQLEETARRRRVVASRPVRRNVLDSPEDPHPVGPERGEHRRDRVRLRDLDEDVRRQVRGTADHQVDELAWRGGSPDAGVEGGVAVVVERQRVRASVLDAPEFVPHGDRPVEVDPSGLGHPEQPDHHRHLHHARRVEGAVGVHEDLVAGPEVAPGEREPAPSGGHARLDMVGEQLQLGPHPGDSRRVLRGVLVRRPLGGRAGPDRHQGRERRDPRHSFPGSGHPPSPPLCGACARTETKRQRECSPRTGRTFHDVRRVPVLGAEAVPTDTGSHLNRRRPAMFRRVRPLPGAVLVAGLLLALGASPPHVHGPDGAPVESCAICHVAHERSLQPAPVLALQGSVVVDFAALAPGPRSGPDPAPRTRPRTRAPPA
jgi:hypothetical protein